jgi:PilZ domain-containing protein
VGHSNTQARGGALTLDDLRGKSTGRDRRREVRFPCEREIAVLPYQAVGQWEFKRVGLFDCSGRGLGIVSDVPMIVGEEFVAKLKLKNSMALVIYQVRHCDPLNKSYFKIGAEFRGVVGASSDVDPEQILATILKPDATTACAADATHN